jgi:hypothetical protein
LAVADDLIEIQNRRLLGKRNWTFLEKPKTITLVASTQFYQLAINIKKIKSCYVTIGTNRYEPKECTTREMWDRLNQSAFTSDIPEYYFVFDGQIGLWPTPASSSNVLTIIVTLQHKKLSIADYTTGNILTAANASPSIVGTGTSWALSMAGRYLEITESDTANKGDGEIYEISAAPTATTITLVKNYNGTAITAGAAAYIIGQCSIIPESYRDVPILGAIVLYYKTIKPETDLAQAFKDEYLDRFNEMVVDYGQKSTSPVLDDGGIDDLINPNLTLTL